jgi:hypothetical protein
MEELCCSNPTRSIPFLFSWSVNLCTFKQGFKKKLAKAVKNNIEGFGLNLEKKKNLFRFRGFQLA